MWMPETEEDIIIVAKAGSLEESPSFDAKRELPSKNDEIAKDVAAMSNDGGVILFGIGEDKEKRLTLLNPIKLAGAPEKIDSIVRSSISEPPHITISTIPTSKDPSVGYILILVPQSARAPHMVTVKNDNRFYGRSGKGNVILNEGEIARLYQRRRLWEENISELIEEQIRSSKYPQTSDLAYLYLIVKPVASKGNILKEALQADMKESEMLNQLVHHALSHDVTMLGYRPDFSKLSRWIRQPDSYLGELGHIGEADKEKKVKLVLDIEVGFDGSCRLFCGRGAERREDGTLIVFPPIVAGITLRTLLFASELYRRASYYGLADIGLAITGLNGALPDAYTGFLGIGPRRYPKDRYLRCQRYSALDLVDNPRRIAKELVMPLVETLTQSKISPFIEVENGQDPAA